MDRATDRPGWHDLLDDDRIGRLPMVVAAPHRRRRPDLGDEFEGEARLAIVRAAAAYRAGMGAAFVTYATRAAHNAILGVYRDARPAGYRYREHLGRTPPATAPLGDWMAAPGRPDPPAVPPGLAVALESLTPEQAAVVRLRFWDGLPLAEAARRLGIAPHAAGERLERALRRLRVALRADAPGSAPAGARECVA